MLSSPTTSVRGRLSPATFFDTNELCLNSCHRLLRNSHGPLREEMVGNQRTGVYGSLGAELRERNELSGTKMANTDAKELSDGGTSK